MRVTVADGQAVNVGTRQYVAGETFDADDREAQRWLERQLVLPARGAAEKPPTKKAPRKSS